jgi:hypothetical protein
MAKSTKKPSTKKGTSKRRKGEPEDGGNHVRQLAPERAVKTYINELIAGKSRTSEIGQETATATKRASDQGINVPAARQAARFYSKAKMDALKGRVLWEDTVYYLLECTDFEKIAPAGMFSPEEAGRSRKTKQAEMELPEADSEREGQPQSLLDAASEMDQQQQETAH